MDSIWVFHFKLFDIVKPKSLVSLVSSKGFPCIRTGVGFVGNLPKSMQNSLHLSLFSLNFLVEHWVLNESTETSCKIFNSVFDSHQFTKDLGVTHSTKYPYHFHLLFLSNIYLLSIWHIIYSIYMYCSFQYILYR